MQAPILLTTFLLSSLYPLLSCSSTGSIGHDVASSEEQPFVQLADPINEGPIVSEFERLDADALALLTARLDLESYANVLRASPILLQKARLPDYQEHQKLAEAAKTISTLDHHNYEQRNQLHSLLRGARMLYRLRSQVPVLLEADEGEPLKETADRFLLTYEECTGLSKLTLHNQERWALNCLEAFAVKNYLGRLWPCLPRRFQSDHLLDVCVASIRRHNIKAFEYFATIAKTKSPQVLLQHVIPENVGQSGDIRLYEAAISFWPLLRIVEFWHMVILGAAEAGQLRLLQQLSKKYRPLHAPLNLRVKVVLTACKYGNVELLKHYQEDSAVRELELWCIVEAAEGGNTHILKHLLWNHHADMPMSESRLPYPSLIYQLALIAALRYNRMEVVRFLMQRSQDGQQLWPSVHPAARSNEALAIAFSRGHMEAIEMFFERDEMHVPRFPNFTIGGFENRVLLMTVKAGRLDMIEYMVEAVDNHMDARYDDLDFAVDENLPLEIAANHGHVEIVRYFLRKKVEGHLSFQTINVAARDGAIFAAACRAGHVGVVRMLMRFVHNEDGLHDGWANDNPHGGVADGRHAPGPLPRPNHDHRAAAAPPRLDLGVLGNPALRLAIQGGHVEIVQFLLQRIEGVPRYPNFVVRYDTLVMAAETGNSTMVQTLLPHVPPRDIQARAQPLPPRNRHVISSIFRDLLVIHERHRDPLLRAALRSGDYAMIKMALRCRYPALDENATMDEIARLVLEITVYRIPPVFVSPLLRQLRGLPSSEWDQTLIHRAYAPVARRCVKWTLMVIIGLAIWPPWATVLGLLWWILMWLHFGMQAGNIVYR